MNSLTDSGISIKKNQNSKIYEVDFENIVFGRVYSDHMLEADFIDGKWQQAEIKPYADIKLAPSCSGIHYGQSIFEGMKAYRHNENTVSLFRPHENWKRINRSAERMCMAEIPEEIFIDGLRELVNLDKDWVPNTKSGSLYIRPVLFGNDDYIGLKASQNYKFLIFTCPVNAYYSEPVKVKFERKYSRAAKGGTGAAKTAGNYAGSLHPAQLANQQGYDQLIWTDSSEHEYIEEAGTMNLMFVVDGKILTPALNDSILPGITRMSAIELLKDWGMEVQERPIKSEEIIAAMENGSLTEAFGVGTAATVAHISVIGTTEKNYELPAVNQREVSTKLLKELDDIKYGRIEDQYNWNVLI